MSGCSCRKIKRSTQHVRQGSRKVKSWEDRSQKPGPNHLGLCWIMAWWRCCPEWRCGGGWRTWPCFVVDSRREQLAIAATNLESLQFHASVRSCPGSISYFITIPSSVVDAVVVVFRLLLAESFLHINRVLRRYPSASGRGISAFEGAGRQWSNITNQMFCDFSFGVLAWGTWFDVQGWPSQHIWLRHFHNNR